MDGLTLPFSGMPPETPLPMAAQSLRQKPARLPRPASSPRSIAWRRLLVVGGAVVLTVVATREMSLVLGSNGLTGLAYLILALFVSLFAWIALALTSAIAGFISVLSNGGRRLDTVLAAPVQSRTALLMPAYNEAPARIMAALEALHHDLTAAGARTRFDLFILSDTRDPAAWIAEEAAFLQLRARIGGAVFYRRRAQNTERKAGNISDWIRRWGGGYDHFLILDADSVMTADCVTRLVAAMERTPDAGLIQSLPVIVGGRTLFARMQQFAGRLYGPIIAHGIAWWHGAEGNYWGHNAIIRTRAFAEAAGLPSLSGRKPFGGHILSHDFVEAALLRRAGWAVHMMPAIEGSYEEGPPSLTDVAVRDRRWCQGNLQHGAVLPTRGLHWVSRLHLMMGIGAYGTAPLWLAFLLAGIVLSLEAHFVLPNYFPTGPSLFPRWPVVDPVRSMWLFIITMAVLLGPKILATLAGILRAAERRAFGGGIRLIGSMLVETLLAGLIAPIAMLTQTAAVVSILAGRDGGWQPQRREDGAVPWRDVIRAYLPHTLAGLALGIASALVSLPLLLWMTPVVIGLALAIPLASFTSRRSAGAAFARVGLLGTPEERSRLPVLARVTAAAAEYTVLPDPVAALFTDPGLLAAHRAMLPPAHKPGEPYDPALLVARAKLEDSGSFADARMLLTRSELAAALTDASCLDRLFALTT
ncbi:MAG: glucans biosynthesis glucosyltransferase MdoH [Pseudomonadota bacterium]|nr:glucans biosynthesis glucosyltransferase MdoH [Pseudomonadota bacterium]